MGFRVHVIKKKVIEYGNLESFNYAHGKFQDCLSELGCDVLSLSGTDDYEPAEFEIEKGEYRKAIKKLKRAIKKHNESPSKKNFYYEVISYSLEGYTENGKQVSPEWLLNVMQTYLKECYRKSDYITFSTF